MHNYHNMKNKPCSLYDKEITDLNNLLATTIEQSLDSTQQKVTTLFFRADDIGIPSKNFSQMISLFQKYSVPLCLATVPTWLTDIRLAQLQKDTGKNNSLFCWHQHGWLHKNYEDTGKKHEFGISRKKETIKQNLSDGKERLQQILGDEFGPFFTPPWNRCSQDTIASLVELNFQALSRSKGAQPKTPATLPDIQVNVDLHTRKEESQQDAVTNILQELNLALSSGQAGIMLHHQRMNDLSFVFLETLLSLFSSHKNIQTKHFGNMFS